ncbi:Uma2 family endonuclease [Frankia sp. AgKG'84/4]|uniref:Uma2 family endonuclease n=1 Tax=Frankia sp. AgKG'84/4 TaxID=573490 RepID=UPI00200F099A|nr:Uma2 family endonuclease [Frankia sp. AgKG'84/4]MCL9797131.1 Uma2 family endonuclease [Frankia sp. AgKG'84/4]
MTVPTPPIAVADLDAGQYGDARLELLDGLCVLRPWPTPLRARVTDRLTILLGRAATSGAHVLPTGVGLELSERCLLVPDVVVASSPLGEQRRLRETPFLVVEVADTSTRRYDRTLKLDLYRERGVPACWLIDPEAATLEAFELVAGDHVTTSVSGPEGEFRTSRPFPVTVRISELIDPPEAD